MVEISVIIPVYNGEKYIKRCYDSLCVQKFSDIEMIFVDDGSKDNSLADLREIALKDTRVKVISQKNKKQGGARNSGLKVACGKYISFVDIDDYISNDFLTGLYDVIERNNCDIALTSVIRCKPNGKQNSLLNYTEEKLYTDNYEKSQITIGNGTGRGVWNKLYKKDFLLKNNLWFRENVSYEDCDYCTKAVFLANAVATCPVGNYFYFVNNKSTMRHNLDFKKQHDKYTGIKLATVFELKHGLVKGARVVPKYDYSLFGLNFLRIKERLDVNSAREEFWLFDFVKIFQRKIDLKFD